jgi:endonuclease/exonuclease/phosphatase family metal-dependent hydrolase
MKAVMGIAVAAVIVVAAGVIGFLAWASLGWDAADLGRAEVFDLDRSAPVAGGSLKIITWNIGFGGGLRGGPNDRHPGVEVRQNLGSIGSAIKASGADVVFLQEVDRPSSRTGRIDQVEFLMTESGLKHACFVATWKNNYVPFPYFPLSGHIGPVLSGQAVLSRYPISECRRIPLPQPSENAWWYNRFYLHRAAQHVILDLGSAPGRPSKLDVLNVHLEAFSEDNRKEQAAILVDYINEMGVDRQLVMAGDFNSLPPFSVKTRGFADEDIDFTNDDTIERVQKVPGLREVIIDETPGLPPTVFHTFPAAEPTRRLDYIFHRGFVGSILTRVPRKAIWSDHLPIVTEVLF